MANQLQQLIEMLDSKMNFFMIKECASSIGFELTSMSVPSLKIEIESLIAYVEIEQEANTMVVI